MFGWVRAMPPRAWILLSLVAGWSVVSIFLRSTGVIDSTTLTYWVQPAAIGVIAVVGWGLSRGKSDRLHRKSEKIAIVASIIALWAIIYFLSGLITTYIQNPLVASPRAIIFNGIAFFATGIAVEYIRFRLVLLAGRHKPLLIGSGVVIVFSLVQFNVGQLFSGNTEQVIQLIFSGMVPVIIHNTVLTYMAYTSGLGAMLIYRGGWELLASFLPILPKYDWYLIGMSVLLVGVVTIIALDRTRQDRTRPLRFRRHHATWLSEAAFITVLVALILFMTGIFSYRPTAIMSNSMQPVYGRGDMVITQQLSDSMDIAIGDILQYQKDGTVITHRVITIDTSGDEPVYRTKGDNNPDEDTWTVTREHVQGIVQGKIPYIGYPTVLLYELIQKGGQ